MLSVLVVVPLVRCRALPRPGLPQAPRGPVPLLRDIPARRGGDRGRNARLRRAVLLPPLRIVRLRTQRGRGRSEPRVPGCTRPAGADLRVVDHPPRILAAAVPARETLRARP